MLGELHHGDGYEYQASCRLHGDGCKPVVPEDIDKMVATPGAVVWINLVVSDPERARADLTALFGLDASAIDHVLVNEVSTFQESEGDLFLCVRKVSTEALPERYQAIGVRLTNELMITISGRRSKSLDRWFERWHQYPEQVGDRPCQLLANLIDEVVDDYYPVLDRLEDDIDAMETRIFSDEPPSSQEMLVFKRRMLDLRRNATPLRDIVNSLLRRDITTIPMDDKPLFQDLYDHALRLIERVDMNRDLLGDLLDARLGVISNNMNQIMKVLTVVSTILMSISLISGIYGMNFDSMPELHWRYGYPLVLGSMAVIVAFELWIFRRIGWL